MLNASIFLNIYKFPNQGHIETSDIEFAKSKLVQGLRNVVKEVLGENGAVITENEIEGAIKPLNLIVPANHTLFTFKLSRDSRERVFCIMFENQSDGKIDRFKQAKIWQTD